MEKKLSVDKASLEKSVNQDSGIQQSSTPSQILSFSSNDSMDNEEEVSQNIVANSPRRRTYQQLSIDKASKSETSSKICRIEKEVNKGSFGQVSDPVILQEKSDVARENPMNKMDVSKVQMQAKNMSGNIVGASCVNIKNVTNYYGNTSSSKKKKEESKGTKESEEKLAIEQVKQYQAEHKEKEVICPKNIKTEETIPQVNPVMRKIPLHLALVDDTTYDSDYRNDDDEDHGDPVKLDGLLKLLDSHKFIALFGPPGCGKTTCSKRLANSSKKFCIWLRLSQLGSSDRTLRELLLDKNYSDLDRKTCENVFDWIKKHQEECTLIMDGFDQLPWSFVHAAVEQGSYDDVLHPKQLIANLFGKKFLPKIRLVLTSRSYALMPLPDDLRPDLTIRLQDLSTDDMEKLFRFFCGDEADSLWKKLNAEAPLLLSLCHNPLMLNFLVSAIKSNRQSKVTEIRTTTTMFETLLRQLHHSKHWRSSTSDHKQLFRQLGSLAYRATKRCVLVFTVDDLKRENLELKDVQDLMFSVADYEFENEKLFETEDTKLYFVHQTWQEFFAAYFLCHCMDWEQFQNSVRAIVCKPQWLMVRRFLCGLLTSPAGKELKRKAKMFFKELEKHFEKLSTSSNHVDLLHLMQDLLECDEKMAERFAVHFPDEADFNHTELRLSAAHALGKMICFVPEPLTSLDLRNCYPNHESLKKICDGLVEMQRKHKQKIKELDLSLNRFKSEVVETLCKVIPHVEERLLLCGAFDYGDGMERPNLTDLEQLIAARDSCDNQNLQIYPSSGCPV